MDVLRDPAAREELLRLTGGRRVAPVIVIGERVIVGFDPQEVERALERGDG